MVTAGEGGPTNTMLAHQGVVKSCAKVLLSSLDLISTACADVTCSSGIVLVGNK